MTYSQTIFLIHIFTNVVFSIFNTLVYLFNLTSVHIYQWHFTIYKYNTIMTKAMLANLTNNVRYLHVIAQSKHTKIGKFFLKIFTFLAISYCNNYSQNHQFWVKAGDRITNPDYQSSSNKFVQLVKDKLQLNNSFKNYQDIQNEAEIEISFWIMLYSLTYSPHWKKVFYRNHQYLKRLQQN